MRDVGLEVPEKGFTSGVHLAHGVAFVRIATDTFCCLGGVRVPWCSGWRRWRAYPSALLTYPIRALRAADLGRNKDKHMN